MKKFLIICLWLGAFFMLLEGCVQVPSHKKMLNVSSNNQLKLSGVDHFSILQNVAQRCVKATFRVCHPNGEKLYGSAVLIDKERGILLSAGHVVAGGPNIVAYQDVNIPILALVNDFEGFDVGIICVDPNLLLDFDCISLPLAGYNVVLGTYCLASGYSGLLGGGLAISSGMILERRIVYNLPMYQMEVVLHGGMSGGPVVDLQGNVIGVVCYSIGRTTRMGIHFNQGFGGCTPIIDVRKIIDRLIQEAVDEFK